jgi:hypothetical protein
MVQYLAWGIAQLEVGPHPDAKPSAPVPHPMAERAPSAFKVRSPLNNIRCTTFFNSRTLPGHEY